MAVPHTIVLALLELCMQPRPVPDLPLFSCPGIWCWAYRPELLHPVEIFQIVIWGVSSKGKQSPYNFLKEVEGKDILQWFIFWGCSELKLLS